MSCGAVITGLIDQPTTNYKSFHGVREANWINLAGCHPNRASQANTTDIWSTEEYKQRRELS
jgi:hypothetical protein